MSSEVWVKIDGALTVPLDPPSTWAIGSAATHAREVLEFAAQFGNVIIYGTPCASLRGQRAAQRWMIANDLPYFWVTHEQTPPPGVEVIDRWPMSTKSNSSEAGLPPTAPSTPPSEIEN